MQGKGLIKVIALLLLAICSYQLLFTWKANQIENNAIALAEKEIPSEDPAELYPNDLIQQFLYKDSIQKARIEYKNRCLDSIASEKVFLGSTFKKVKENQLNLGLDLQGGMSAVLQVNIKELLQSLSDNNTSPVFNDALDLAESRMSESADDFITLFVKAVKEKSPNAKLADFFATRANNDFVKANTSDDDVLKFIREESNNAIHRTYNIISTRIDQFGLRQPLVTLEPRKGRITVEIGGVDNPARVRSMLQATASLEFWETYKANEIGGSINQANDALKLFLQAQKGVGNDASDKGNKTSELSIDNILGDDAAAAKSSSSTLDDILGDGDSGTDTATKSDDLLKNLVDNVEDSIASQEKFLAEAPLFAVLNPAIDQNNMYMASPVIGYSLNIDTAKVNSYLKVPEVKNKFPRDIDFMWGAKPIGEKGNIFELYAIKKRPNSDKPFIDGSAVTNSKSDVDQFGRTYIGMEMNGEGARKWKKMTGDNVGKNIAIVVDRAVYSAPNVENEISGGSSSITGAFTKEEATDLSNILKIGKLPASANIIEEETVGATLGAEAIRAGLLSMLAGFIMVIALVIAFYSTGGVFATVVLIMNLFLIVGIMAVFGSTLTLPGIAGIVLTMGMAVDANVLIFERIKEELKNGQTALNAVANGFKHSMSAIIDGNLTTLITGIILFLIGMGPIKGFATTLVIGILTTLFTAILVSNVLIDSWQKKGRTLKVYNKFSETFLTNTKFDFIGKRKFSYIFSVILVLIGIFSITTRGFEMGVDFKGGREYKVRFEQPVNTEQIKASLDKIFEGNTIVKTIGAANQIKATTSFMIDKRDTHSDRIADSTLYLGLKEFLPENTSYQSFRQINILSQQKVDPTMSVDIIKSSTIAVALSLIAIFLYILIRFSTVGFSLGVIVSTAHDAFAMIIIFSLLHGLVPFSLEIDQTFIAALLTVIGYSVNDTVIIFDRLREYLADKTQRKDGLPKLMNAAINSTLTRTFMTSSTTLISLIILFIFGGESLRGFSFAMIVGILIGTYSSVFIASPIMYEYEKRKGKFGGKTTASKGSLNAKS